MFPTVSLSRQDWSLHRKGPADQARHKEKIKEAIRENLAEIVSEEAIITSDGNKIVKVPIRSLELPGFRFDLSKKEHVGQGSGESQVGDVIGQAGEKPGRGGKAAGTEPGIDYYEAEITIDELAELIFQDLGLPNLRPKAMQELESEEVRFKDIRRTGIMPNIDKRRSILASIKRGAIERGPSREGRGRPIFEDLKPEDLRFKTWSPQIRREANAAVIAMRDVSASMGEFEKYISRSFYFWMVRFLRTKYQNVKIVFIAHHTEAKEVDEDAFFKLGESGGTRVSSAYQLALNMIKERYDPARWNIYPFHFSDGDNWGEADNKRCLELVQKMLEACNMFGYGEIREDRTPQLSTLMATFSAIKDEKFVGVTITDKKDVYPALKRFFTTDIRRQTTDSLPSDV